MFDPRWGFVVKYGCFVTNTQNCSKRVLNTFSMDVGDFDLAALRTSQIGSQDFDPRWGFVVKYSCLRYPMKLPRSHHGCRSRSCGEGKGGVSTLFYCIVDSVILGSVVQGASTRS